MDRRRLTAFVLALVLPSLAPAAARAARPTPKAVPSAGAEPAPSPTPSTTDAPSASPSGATSAAPTPLFTAQPFATKGFVYLRDRYRNDDQGKALRTPIRQLTGLDYMLGTWNAHIYTLTDRRKITRDFGHTTYVFARTMRDRWILGTDAKNTEFLYFTYDPAAQQWVYADFKGFPSYGISVSKDTDPRHLVFNAIVETALGDVRRLRTSLVQTDAKHFSLLDEESTPTGWTPVVEFDFSRR